MRGDRAPHQRIKPGFVGAEAAAGIDPFPSFLDSRKLPPIQSDASFALPALFLPRQPLQRRRFSAYVTYADLGLGSLPRALEETDFCGDAFAERVRLVEVVAVQTELCTVCITLVIGAEQMIPDREILAKFLS